MYICMYMCVCVRARTYICVWTHILYYITLCYIILYYVISGGVRSTPNNKQGLFGPPKRD